MQPIKCVSVEMEIYKIMPQKWRRWRDDGQIENDCQNIIIPGDKVSDLVDIEAVGLTINTDLISKDVAELPNWKSIQIFIAYGANIWNWPIWQNIEILDLRYCSLFEVPKYQSLRTIILDSNNVLNVDEKSRLPYWSNIEKIYIDPKNILLLPFYSRAEVICFNESKAANMYFVRRAIYFHVLLHGCIIKWRRFLARKIA